MIETDMPSLQFQHRWLQPEECLHVLSVPQMSLTGTERVGVEQDFDERSEIEFEPGPGQKLAVMVATEE